MNPFTLREEEFKDNEIIAGGNKFLIGNGYLGIRGTLEEFEKNELVAINLAGIYDQVGTNFREPLNAPNGLFSYIKVGDKSYRLPKDIPLKHEVSLNYRHGIYSRSTTFQTEQGQIVIKAERFASLAKKHLIAMEYCVQTDFDGAIEIITGIDADVWDINGPHYKALDLTSRTSACNVGDFDSNILQAVAITQENQDKVCVLEAIQMMEEYKELIHIHQESKKILRSIKIEAKASTTYCLRKFVSVYTSKDTVDCLDAALRLLDMSIRQGYEKVKKEHIEEWEKKWFVCEVKIEGDDEAMRALNYSLYHLNCIAPRHSDSLSIAARGLSGQTYKGAVFWDTEMFMLDFFLFTEPSVAKTLLKYRVDTLDGAKKKAASYHHKGAFYAWESQEGGFDACSDYNVIDVFTKRPMRTYFRDKQIHISAAVVYGLMSYVDFTGDDSILTEGGFEVILECAIFYYSLLIKKLDSDYYELHDVIGPDEYHERVNNNAYTNRMAKYTFDAAILVLERLQSFSRDTIIKVEEQYDLNKLKTMFSDASKHIYIPTPDIETKIIEQFDGYRDYEDASIEDVKKRLLDEKEYWGGAYGVASHTKVIKQADVVTMLTLFSNEYSMDTMLKNWDYYESRTEHGSSLSACMYALLACYCNLPDRAYPFFMKSALADIAGGGKQWAGLLYIGGTHPASAGGAYMTAIKGFGGFSIQNGEISVTPKLPSHWKKLIFRIVYRGGLYEIEETGNDVKITKMEKSFR